MFLFTIHIALLKQVKAGFKPFAWTNVLQAVQDLLITGVLLMPELVAREAQYHQPAIPKGSLELVHLGVIPYRRASERRHVLDEHHLSLEGVEVEDLSRSKQPRGKIVETFPSHDSPLN